MLFMIKMNTDKGTISISSSFHFIGKRLVGTVCYASKTKFNILTVRIATISQFNVEVSLVTGTRCFGINARESVRRYDWQYHFNLFRFCSNLTRRFNHTTSKADVSAHRIGVAIHIGEFWIINGAPVCIRTTKL